MKGNGIVAKKTLIRRISDLKEQIDTKRLRWYNVALFEAFEEQDEEKAGKISLLHEAVREMGVYSQIGRVQGTVFKYIHCTESQMNQLAEKSGIDTDHFVELDQSMVLILHLHDPRLLRKATKTLGIKQPDSPML